MPPSDPLKTMALKERVGTVVSDKMDKTVVVAVVQLAQVAAQRLIPHPAIVLAVLQHKKHQTWLKAW